MLGEEKENKNEKPEHETKEEPMEENLHQDYRQQSMIEHAMPKKRSKLNHRQKIFLTLSIIIAAVLIGTIVLFIQKKQSSEKAALFTSIYPPAEQKYEEGIGLKDLNPSAAHDDFSSAYKMLADAKPKFSVNSSEEKQITTLLDKVNSELSATQPENIPSTDVTKVDNKEDAFMNFVLSNSTGKYFTQDSIYYYFADNIVRPDQ